jgi:hypothetical protein
MTRATWPATIAATRVSHAGGKVMATAGAVVQALGGGRSAAELPSTEAVTDHAMSWSQNP